MLSRPKRVFVAQVAAFLYHVIVVMLVVVLTRSQHAPDRARPIDDAVVVPDQLVFLVHVGDGQMRGGGGGGDDSPLPASRVRVPGRDRTSVPIAQPDSYTLREPETPPDTQQVVLDARRVGSDSTTTPGLLEVPTIGDTAGPGDGGGAGNGDGRGLGDGRGPGVGPGQGGDTGGGIHDPRERGVTSPVALVIEKPQYTTAAMQAHIQGSVLVECVVDRDGTCREPRVVRSLDRSFGLDQEAVKATRRWRFKPGTLFGKAVPVLVHIELDFVIR